MYIKSILSAILLATLGASPASAIATGWAMAETCGDEMNTAEDCYAKCKTLAEGGAWNANVKLGFKGELTECKCVIHSPNAAPGLPTENIWTCTREPQKPEPKKPEPQPPKPQPPKPQPRLNENCNSLAITTWQGCIDHCHKIGLVRASRAGAADNISRCTCFHGPGMTNSAFECTRSTTESYLRATN